MTDGSHVVIQGTWKSYILGFLLSVFLTLAAYFAVVYQWFPKDVTLMTIIGLALAQGVVQLVLFLHLGHETKPRSKLIMFLLTVLILAIVILGTLWIMYDLDDRTMHMKDMFK